MEANQLGPILVIDDEPDLCQLVGLVLTAAGFKVVSASDGLAGIELAQKAQPTIILLDMIMPGLDGVSTCRSLKQNPVLKGIPVVGITASTELGYTEKAFRAGAEFFLAKPFGRQSLVEIVNLAAQRAQRKAGHRGQTRFRTELPVRCVVPGEREAAREVIGHTVNVSLDGFLLLLSETIGEGIVLRVQLRVPEGIVTVEGTVIWKGDEVDDQIIPHGVQVLGFVEESEFFRYTGYLAQMA